MTHELKILPKYFEDVMTGKKNFEIRKNDRDFKVGDYLLLKEWERGNYTGREVKKRIQYIYFGNGAFGLSKEYCVLALEERPTGEWTFEPDIITPGNPYGSYKCSNCKNIHSDDADYCPNCGAKMKGEE